MRNFSVRNNNENERISLLSKATELQSVLEPFLLRRIKSEVAVDLPKKTELVVYHGMSALQKKYYKAILMRDLGEDWAPEQWILEESRNEPYESCRCVWK